MYEIEFYDDERGYSDVEEFIKELREKSATSKDARINFIKLLLISIFLRKWVHV